MKLLKNKHLPLLFLVITGTLSVFVVASPVPAAAAPEGCYEKTSFTSTVRYDLVDCPLGANARISDPGEICYVTTVRGATSVSDFTVESCDSFQDGTTRIAQTQQANQNPTDNPDFGRGINEDCESTELTSENCSIVEYLVIGINFLSAAAGMVIVGSLMMAGYQYMTARDNSGQIMKARMRIVWTLVSLLLFVFMYALLNFLIPGGVL